MSYLSTGVEIIFALEMILSNIYMPKWWFLQISLPSFGEMTFSIQWETLKRLLSDTFSKKRATFYDSDYNLSQSLYYFIYRNAFLFDLLSVVPFRFFFVPKIQAIKTSNNLQLLHLFKLFRLKKIFQLLETRYVNNIIKEYYKSKLKNKLMQLK